MNHKWSHFKDKLHRINKTKYDKSPNETEVVSGEGRDLVFLASKPNISLLNTMGKYMFSQYILLIALFFGTKLSAYQESYK